MKRVGELVENRPVYSVPLSTTVADAVAYMAERKVGAVSVLEQERLVGIFSERDLMKRVVVAGRDPRQTPLAEVITRDPLVTDADEAPAACLERMRQAGIRHLPVFLASRLLGLVTMRDLLLADLQQKGDEVRLMRAYISLTSQEQ